jgi:hypothetical protein
MVTSHEGESRDTITITFLHHRDLHYKSFQKKYEVSNLEKTLQTVKTMIFGSEKHTR